MLSIEKATLRASLYALFVVSACSFQDFNYLQSGSSSGGNAGAGTSGGKVNTGGGESTGGSVHNGGTGGSTQAQGGAGGEATGGGAGEAGATSGGATSGGTSGGGGGTTSTGGENPGGAGGTPDTGPPVGNLLVNPSFESGLTNWIIEPKEAAVPPTRYVYTQFPTGTGTTKDGSQILSTWHETAEYQLTVSQVVTKLIPGKYQFKGWFSTTQLRQAFAFSRNCGGAEQDVDIPAIGFPWFEIAIPEINVTGTSCEVGVYVHGMKPEGLMPDWFNADMFTFEWVAPP